MQKRCVVVLLLLLALIVSCRRTSSEPAARQASIAPNTAPIGGPVPETAARAARPLLSSTADLRDKNIAVQLGTVYDLYAASTFPGATVMQFNTFQEVTLAVSAGKADAGLSDLDTFNEVKRANTDLVAFGKPIFTSEVAAGFAKSGKGLRASFNGFLKS